MPLSLVKVKICGIRDLAILRAAVGYGADAVGFVVKSPSSPRNISLEVAKDLISAAPPLIYTVAVTASTSVDEILEAVERLRPDAVQLHSRIGLDAISEISGRLRGGVKLIGALAVDVNSRYSEVMVRDLTLEAKGLAGLVDALIVDSAIGGFMGGTGVRGNFEVARRIRDAVAPSPLILAGGLTSENVEEAISVVEPYAVDVSSGVESSPGVKDLSKVKLFIEKVRRLN
ncbi:MAG: phosphoribosylanthranilate isomerase [Candidatus Bathyarchaeia archaeon]